MPRPEINNYTFYKIVNVNGDVELCYVGSTCNMKKRREKHKYNCINPTSRNHHNKVYATIREHGGWDEFKIVEIGYREQITLTQSHQIEEEYRVEFKATLNMVRCFITEEERKEGLKKAVNMWCENNKEYVVLRRQKYYENNKEKKLLNAKIKVVCECGSQIRKCGMPLHKRTKKHINLMNAKTD